MLAKDLDHFQAQHESDGSRFLSVEDQRRGPGWSLRHPTTIDSNSREFAIDPRHGCLRPCAESILLFMALGLRSIITPNPRLRESHQAPLNPPCLDPMRP